MLFTLKEVLDILIMTGAVGYIFMDMFKAYNKTTKEAFIFACMVTAPALIAHELAHKFVALSYGLQAEFHAAYIWLVIAIALKLLKTGFIFFVPAYVSIIGTASQTAFGLTAFAGPFLNFVLFAGAWLLLKQKRVKRNAFIFLSVTKQINLFLFIFNMLPIPMFDGFKVYQAIFQALF